MNEEINHNNHKSSGTAAATEGESRAGTTAEHPVKTGLWVLGVVLLYYALQAWILPAAGVQT